MNTPTLKEKITVASDATTPATPVEWHPDLSDTASRRLRALDRALTVLILLLLAAIAGVLLARHFPGWF